MSPTVSRILACLILAIAAGLIGVQLFVSPIVGFADNGDFRRVMEPVGLDYLSERYEERHWNWALKEFAVVKPGHMPDDVPLSEFLLAKVAASLSRPFAPKLFDIRVLGTIHAVLLLAFFFLLIVASRDLDPFARLAALGLAVFFYSDVGYIAPLNSLYGQVASLIFFLLAAGIAALGISRGRLAGAGLVWYFLCATLFVVSKPQECLHGPILAVLGYRLARIPARKAWRQSAAWMGVALCAIAIWSYAVIPKRTVREVGLYHSVFMELLRTSPDPARDLSALGLKTELVRFVGVTAYAPNAPLANSAFRESFFDRFGYGDLTGFYLLHPARLFDRLWRAGRRAFQLRPGNLGNFDQASGQPAGSLSHRVDAWSSARARLGRYGLFWIAILTSANLIAAVRLTPRTPRGRLFRDAMVALCAMAALEFMVCMLGDYLDDVSRHLYVFQAMWDLIVIADIAWAIQVVVARGRLRGDRTDGFPGRGRARLPGDMRASLDHRHGADGAGRRRVVPEGSPGHGFRFWPISS